MSPIEREWEAKRENHEPILVGAMEAACWAFFSIFLALLAVAIFAPHLIVGLFK